MALFTHSQAYFEWVWKLAWSWSSLLSVFWSSKGIPVNCSALTVHTSTLGTHITPTGHKLNWCVKKITANWTLQHGQIKHLMVVRTTNKIWRLWRLVRHQLFYMLGAVCCTYCCWTTYTYCCWTTLMYTFQWPSTSLHRTVVVTDTTAVISVNIPEVNGLMLTSRCFTSFDFEQAWVANVFRMHTSIVMFNIDVKDCH